MSATLRLIDAINNGDLVLPEHAGLERLLVRLLLPIYDKPGSRAPRKYHPRKAQRESIGPLG